MDQNLSYYVLAKHGEDRVVGTATCYLDALMKRRDQTRASRRLTGASSEGAGRDPSLGAYALGPHCMTMMGQGEGEIPVSAHMASDLKLGHVETRCQFYSKRESYSKVALACWRLVQVGWVVGPRRHRKQDGGLKKKFSEALMRRGLVVKWPELDASC